MSEIADSGRLGLIAELDQALDLFSAGAISSDRLSWCLKSGISALGLLDDSEWVEELRTVRNDIEYVNAFFIESGRELLGDNERQEIGALIIRFRSTLYRDFGD